MAVPPQPTAGGVWISPEMMYDELRQTREAVQGLRGDVGRALALEQRVTALEAAIREDQGAAHGMPRPAGPLTPAAAWTGVLAGVGAVLWQIVNGG